MPIAKRKFLTDTFVQRLKLAMMRSQISASELARRTGVTPTAVWNWKRGYTMPRPQALMAIAGVLNVTEDYLRVGPVHDMSKEACEQPNPPSSADSIAELVEDLRVRIAGLTGFSLEQVKLNLELKSD